MWRFITHTQVPPSAWRGCCRQRLPVWRQVDFYAAEHEYIKNMPPALTERVLTATEVITSLAQLEGWRLSGDGADIAIEKTFAFANFYQTMAFVNALAFIAHAQNHHPELLVQFGECRVRWRTHAVAGLSKADFDCAARTDALLTA
jgi:4a-hydroxytetrahydrobiopterin dehydratase